MKLKITLYNSLAIAVTSKKCSLEARKRISSETSGIQVKQRVCIKVFSTSFAITFFKRLNFIAVINEDENRNWERIYHAK